MKKILYLGPSGIGDWCFIYPSLTALLAKYGAEKIDLVIPYPNAGNQLLSHNQLIGDVHYLKRQLGGIGLIRYLFRWLNRLQAIRQEHYQAIVISFLSNQPDMLLLARLSGCHKRVGIHTQPNWLQKSAINNPVDAGDEQNRLTLHQLYAAEPQYQSLTPPPFIASNSADEVTQLLQQYDINRPYIVLGAGGGRNAQWRFWPAHHYAELINLGAHFQWVILGGGDDDQAQAQSILRHTTQQQRVKNLVDKTSMPDALALISQAHAVVGNDSGIANLSTVMKTPTLCLYGPTSALLTGPALNGAIALESKLACRPCFDNQMNPEKAIHCPDRECLEHITPQQVYNHLPPLKGY
ncbi:MAG: glycosyltransferase family 9 protein [Gammaproteobacteria bacterium]|nr:glycosyltransferase family 9 protein [Gammaproteobacteria bacterium]MCF6230056.1 glycosyltransferase family 9 protein [Gammaproteobacteria bacterium]